MSARQMRELREAAKLTQTEMADLMGLGISGYQDLEKDDPDWKRFKPRHMLALERVSLKLAVEQNDINLALPTVRRDALDLARLITGVDGSRQIGDHRLDLAHLSAVLAATAARVDSLPYKVDFFVNEAEGVITAKASRKASRPNEGATTGDKIGLFLLTPETGVEKMLGFLEATMGPGGRG